MKITATIEMSEEAFERVNAETLTITSGELSFCDSLKSDIETALDDLNVSYKLNVLIDNRPALATALFAVTPPHVWADLLRSIEEAIEACEAPACKYCIALLLFMESVNKAEKEQQPHISARAQAALDDSLEEE